MDLDELTRMAAAELARHGLAGWTFGLGATQRRLGACKYRRKRIEIDAYYATHNPPAAVRDTLLHEIAHAIAGPSAGHGPAWRAVAARIGATPRACDSSPDTVVRPGDWQAACPGCGRTHHRYRQPRATGYRCRCPARSPLAFAFAGDPATRPPDGPPPERRAGWRAACPGCAVVHARVRRPKPGEWLCRCGYRGPLAWAFAPPAG